MKTWAEDIGRGVRVGMEGPSTWFQGAPHDAVEELVRQKAAVLIERATRLTAWLLSHQKGAHR